MKQIDVIYNMFLHKINDPDILEYYTEEEMQLDCDMSIRIVLGKLVYFDIDYDDTTREFSRKLNNTEMVMLSCGLVLEWLSPQIYTIDLIKQNMTSSEFNSTSKANQLKALMELFDKAKNEMNTLYIQNGYKDGIPKIK